MAISSFTAAGVAALALLPGAALAQSRADPQAWPTRPIRIIVQMLFSHPSLPAANVQELIALARARPGQLNCASAGTGTPNHLGCELLKSMAGINFVHVPYKGASPAISDVVGGQMHFMFNSIPAVLPLAKSGKVRALAVAGAKRSPVVPDVPAVAETIPGFECVNWYAMLAPAGTPPAIVAKLNAEIVKMIADPPFAERSRALPPSSPRTCARNPSGGAELSKWQGSRSSVESRIGAGRGDTR